MTTALCPGSFDPPHNGHIEVFEAAARLFDRIVIAPIRNYGKGEPMFSVEERIEMIKESLSHLDNVDVVSMTKLTVDVAQDVGADYIPGASRWLEGHPEWIATDGIHPNDAGHTEIAERMDEALTGLGL